MGETAEPKQPKQPKEPKKSGRPKKPATIKYKTVTGTVVYKKMLYKTGDAIFPAQDDAKFLLERGIIVAD